MPSSGRAKSFEPSSTHAHEPLYAKISTRTEDYGEQQHLAPKAQRLNQRPSVVSCRALSGPARRLIEDGCHKGDQGSPS